MVKKLAYIIEDQEIDRRLLEANLNGMGIETKCAQDFKNTLREIQLLRPHLIILDLNLDTTLQGITILQQLSNSLLSHIPILVCSGDSKKDTLQRVIASGSIDFIVKPYNPQLLKEKILRKLSNSSEYSWKASSLNTAMPVVIKHQGIITGVSEVGVVISSFIKKSPDVSHPIRCHTAFFDTVGVSDPIRVNFLNNEGELHAENLGVPYRTYCQAIGWSEKDRKILRNWMKNKSVRRNF